MALPFAAPLDRELDYERQSRRGPKEILHAL